MERKTCFIICPLGEPDSATRKRSDLLHELVLLPVLKPLGYDTLRADIALDNPSIPETISQHIFGDDLIIADLTDSNPNVFYELGKRHAWNSACIHFTTSVKNLPFDVRHYRVLEYDLDDADLLDRLRYELRMAVRSVEQNQPAPEFPLTADDVVRLSGQTVVVKTASGRDDPYFVSRDIANADCKRMLLMQRSSSLILGPEQGWGAEEEFYRTILDRTNKGVELFHVVSLEGIVRHLQRPQSVFPSVERALGKLIDADGLVAIPGRLRHMYIKKFDEKDDRDDMKPDRQARVFLVERSDGMCEGNFVIDVGNTQCSFQLRGPEVRRFMSRALDFYHQCEYLKLSELLQILAPFRKVASH